MSSLPRKPKSKVFNYFKNINNGTDYKCKFCDAGYKKHATRLANHLINQCEVILPLVKNQLRSVLPHKNKLLSRPSLQSNKNPSTSPTSSPQVSEYQFGKYIPKTNIVLISSTTPALQCFIMSAV